MFASILRRIGLSLSVFLVAMTIGTLPARADAAANTFVQTNAQNALTQLNDPNLSLAERRERFGSLMDQFADLPRIAEFVVGRYAGQLRRDEALYKEWQSVFRDYALTVYAGQLDQYSGNSVKVLSGGKDTMINGKRYAIVPTEISRPNGDVLRANWRLIASPNGWRVVDVALARGDNIIWLGIQQRQDFLAQLGRNGGDMRGLVNDVRAQTKTIKDLMAQRRS